MDRLDKEIAIEKFINAVKGSKEDIERFVSFLRIEDPKQKKLLEESFNIIDKKIKKVKKCKSVKETEKYIKTKKVINKYGEE